MRDNKIKDSVSYRIFTVFNTTILVVLAILCVIPFLHILAVSFSDAASTAGGRWVCSPLAFSSMHMKKFSGTAPYFAPSVSR